jgi:hypothetical protein
MYDSAEKRCSLPQNCEFGGELTACIKDDYVRADVPLIQIFSWARTAQSISTIPLDFDKIKQKSKIEIRLWRGLSCIESIGGYQ